MGSESDRLFAEAENKFAEALALKVDFCEALNNWGVMLYKQAQMATGVSSDRLLVLACEKYSAALDVDPNSHDVL